MAKLRVQFATAIQSIATRRQCRDQISIKFFMGRAKKAAWEGVEVQIANEKREPIYYRSDEAPEQAIVADRSAIVESMDKCD